MADPNERFHNIIKRLRESNHKITPQRMAVVKILARSEGHPSVEKIYKRLQDDFPTMSLATVRMGTCGSFPTSRTRMPYNIDT
jgi:Fur family transcriptional regulator, peroxide stress response regulator